MPARRTLEDWLSWQESLHPRSIDLGLERVARVADRLRLSPPAGRVATVAGTNGKGSTVGFLASGLRSAGLRTGTYTSPHLVRYNERIRLDDRNASDAELVDAFEAVDSVRGADTLTYFEFGTLAAAWLFSRAGLDAWVLEVGLGGRLDAVNIFEPDVSLITTVGLDHQRWLGDTIEAIAAEKAGIMRAGRPALFGDRPVPAAIGRRAEEIGARLLLPDRDFGFRQGANDWSWWSRTRRLDELPLPAPADQAQLRNVSLAFAALEALDGAWPDPAMCLAMLQSPALPGRFQRHRREAHEWVLDVAHNPQAATVLAARLARLPAAAQTTVVLALLDDKDLVGIIEALGGVGDRWVVAALPAPRGGSADSLAAALRERLNDEVLVGGAPPEALSLAVRLTSPGGRIVVCGSFQLVGPALEWLGLY